MKERSVKPSAQPTLVRTQHLPPPAKTARWLRILVAGGPFSPVPACVTLCRCRPLCRGVHGRIADGFCALERSVRTVGCFTDGHGRDAVAARSPACSNAKGGGFQLVGAAPSPAAATICGTSITRPHDRGPDRTADHHRRPPVRRPPQGVGRLSGSADLGARDAPFRPAPAADLRCTLHVPRPCLARAGGRRTRPQPGRSLLDCPGHADSVSG